MDCKLNESITFTWKQWFVLACDHVISPAVNGAFQSGDTERKENDNE